MELDERQGRIAAWLAERRPDLASMYLAGLRTLSQPVPEGDSRVRISYICHAMREVMNRVLTLANPSASPRIKPPSGDQVQQLPDLLVAHPELSLTAESDSVLIPREVAAVFDKLVKTAVQERRRSRDDVASLLTDDGNAANHAVSRWIEARTFFTTWAHLHDRTSDLSELPSDGLIVSHIEIFEELFDGTITAFFPLRHQIVERLAEINGGTEVE